ncbi:MAG TPA: glycosyltransferase, partial [Caulobacteraceae bacterium]|nr:glycosyltransferase [Caulobacteraceae bacterium]
RNETNLGYVRNFLKAAGLCEGDWIAFCDQDDVWAADKLAAVSEAARRHGDAVLVVHAAAVVDEHLNPTGQIVPRLPRQAVLPPLRQPPWFKVQGFCSTFDAALVRRFPHDHLPSNLFAPGRTQTADKRIVWLANALGSTVILHQPLAKYRRHSANVSGLPQTAPRGAGVSADYDRLRAEVLEEYAQELGRFVAMDQPPAIRQRLEAASDQYARAAGWHRLRLALFESGPPARLRAFGRLLTLGAYRAPGGGGLGLRALVRDAALASGFLRPAGGMTARTDA